MFQKIYEEQPASPPVEWFRYANRRAKTLRRWPRNLRRHVLAILLTFGALLVATESKEALERLLLLVLSALVSVVLTPLCEWSWHFLTAFHMLVRAENTQLHRDVAALKDIVDDLSARLRDSTAAVATQPAGQPLSPPTGGSPPTQHVTIPAIPSSVVVYPPSVIQRPSAKEIAKELAALRERAVHGLLNRRVSDDHELAVLKADIAKWERDVLEVLERDPTVADVTRFRVLGLYRFQAVGGYNQEHNAELAMLAERLERLLRIIDRLSGRE